MKLIKNPLVTFIIMSIFFACKKPCNQSLRIGEIVEIPIEFKGFTITEINNILVYRVDNSNTSSIDTFIMRNILWANEARSTNEIITDTDLSNQLGYYASYLDNCTLIFDWHTGKDTLLNIEIKKSQEKIKGCHENDPNVRIDKLSFIHKGRTIHKNESIQINK
ncbi:MAG: hypothetical protein M9892_06020 [Bacteroidetes bacterium]|nr:hypothetical protein [Bacteroidota bacterium]